MSTDRKQQADSGLSTLAEGIISDVGDLIAQHVNLLRSELKEDLKEAKTAALSFGGGAGATALAGIVGSVAVAELLHSATRLPKWACYGTVAGLLGAAGAGLFALGARQAADIDLVPRDTVQTLKEELTGTRHA